MAPNLIDFPKYFCSYQWEDKHNLFGYPDDSYEEFEWIASLEHRFAWVKTTGAAQKTASIYLLREMIQWGGSQNGTLQKLDDGLGEVNLQQLVAAVVKSLHSPADAIGAALDIPGMGLTYASKLLRFFDPESYGALDSRLRTRFESEKMQSALPKKIYDGNRKSMIDGYVAFTKYLWGLRDQLDNHKILRPTCALLPGATPSQWRAADLEMALFAWASPHSTGRLAASVNSNVMSHKESHNGNWKIR